MGSVAIKIVGNVTVWISFKTVKSLPTWTQIFFASGKYKQECNKMHPQSFKRCLQLKMKAKLVHKYFSCDKLITGLTSRESFPKRFEEDTDMCNIINILCLITRRLTFIIHLTSQIVHLRVAYFALNCRNIEFYVNVR